MVLKSTAVLISSASHVLSLPANPATLTTSWPRWSASSHEDSHILPGRQCRRYSTVNDDSGSGSKPDPDLHHWPSHSNPTPYDILNHDRHAPYSKTHKARFYKLVKLYHPDGSTSSSQETLERYRLVVLANDILSDPDKRRAYDNYGLGWKSTTPRDVNDMYRAADRSWRDRPGNPANCATWEDWEKWYREQNGDDGQQGHQRPVFMSNVHFVAVILATIAVGSAMQASRASESASHVVEHRAVHEQAISESLRRQRHNTAGKGKNERIDKFVRERENWKFSFEPDKFEAERGKSNGKSPGTDRDAFQR